MRQDKVAVKRGALSASKPRRLLDHVSFAVLAIHPRDATHQCPIGRTSPGIKITSQPLRRGRKPVV